MDVQLDGRQHSYRGPLVSWNTTIVHSTYHLVYESVHGSFPSPQVTSNFIIQLLGLSFALFSDLPHTHLQTESQNLHLVPRTFIVP